MTLRATATVCFSIRKSKTPINREAYIKEKLKSLTDKGKRLIYEKRASYAKCG